MKKFHTHIADMEEYGKLLEEKLMEEVSEYLEELADVLAVLVRLAGSLGYAEEELFEKNMSWL